MMPGSCLLVGVGGLKERLFLKRFAHELQADGKLWV